MAPEPGKKLFHAIVVVGAALAGCADEPSDDEPRADAARANGATGAATGRLDAAVDPLDASSALDASADATAAAIHDAALDASRDAALDTSGDAASDARGAADAPSDISVVSEDVSLPNILIQ